MSKTAEITALGINNCFSFKEGSYHSHMLLKCNDEYGLIDCPMDVRYTLHKRGLSFKDIKYIFLTHCHMDHIAALELFAFSNRFCGGNTKIITSKELINTLTIPGLRVTNNSNRIQTIYDYYDIIFYDDIECFVFNDLIIDSIELPHVSSPNNKFNVMSNAIRICNVSTENRIFYTGDYNLTDDLYRLLLSNIFDGVDIIFSEVEFGNPSGVHANVQDIKRLFSGDHIKKSYFYHYDEMYNREIRDDIQLLQKCKVISF